jgi:DNA-binding IclR family transcriptional regulator
MMITKQAGRAMAAQLDRVNDAIRHEEIARLQRENDRLRQQIAQLREQLAAYEDQGYSAPKRAIGKTIDGRPVLSIKEVATMLHEPYYRVWRAIEAGYIAATQDSSRQWRVYGDQPISIPARITQKKSR